MDIVMETKFAQTESKLSYNTLRKKKLRYKNIYLQKKINRLEKKIAFYETKKKIIYI